MYLGWNVSPTSQSSHVLIEGFCYTKGLLAKEIELRPSQLIKSKFIQVAAKGNVRTVVHTSLSHYHGM
jgi:hypothetical protein